jgi:dynein light chain LC8-type
MAAVIDNASSAVSSPNKEAPELTLTPKPSSLVAFKFEVRQTDMAEDLYARALSHLQAALEVSYSSDNERDEGTSGMPLRPLAEHVKRAMDEEFGFHWHCIVGRSFGSFVTHEPGRFLFGYLNDEWAVMLFKTI